MQRCSIEYLPWINWLLPSIATALTESTTLARRVGAVTLDVANIELQRVSITVRKALEKVNRCRLGQGRFLH